MTEAEIASLLQLLKGRFENHMHRHPLLSWKMVESRLKGAKGWKENKLMALAAMEQSGGEPDVVSLNKEDIVFMDCAPESPKGRRSLCYDGAALESRKLHKPKNSAAELALAMGVEMLNEDQYRLLQEVEKVDNKTSSWLKTPMDIRQKGGAIFGDHRFGRTFVYHNGAESYYASRGFRGFIKL